MKYGHIFQVPWVAYETIRLFQEEKSTKAKLNIIFSKLNMPVRTRTGTFYEIRPHIPGSLGGL